MLANEEVVGGVCERCGGEVVHKVKSQWMLKITAYAQRLIDDLDDRGLHRPRQDPAEELDRPLHRRGGELRHHGGRRARSSTPPARTPCLAPPIWSSRPEHPCIEKWADKITNMDAVRAYQAEAARRSPTLSAPSLHKEKTGVRLEGVRGHQPGERQGDPHLYLRLCARSATAPAPSWRCPPTTTRDWEFAKKFGLPIIEVVKGGDVEKEAFTDCATGVMVNSGFLDGLTVEEAKKKITEWLAEKGMGTPKVNYKLRDWVFCPPALLGRADPDGVLRQVRLGAAA